MPKKKMYPGYPHGGQVGPDPKPEGRRSILAGIMALLNRGQEQDSVMGARMDEAAASRQAKDDFQRFLMGRENSNLMEPDEFGIQRPLPPVLSSENFDLLSDREIMKGLSDLWIQEGMEDLGPAMNAYNAASGLRVTGPTMPFKRRMVDVADRSILYGDPETDVMFSDGPRVVASDRDPLDKWNIPRRESIQNYLDSIAPLGRASGGIIGLSNGGIPAGGSAVTSHQLNPAVAQQYANLTDRIVTEGQRQYAASPNQRIAGIDPATQTALMGREQYAMGPGPMGTQQAAQSYGQAGQMIQGGYGQLGGIGAQQQNLAGQFGLQGQQARNLAMQDARGLAGLGAQARMQGQTAGAGMLQSGLAAQQEQQLLGGRQGALGTGAMSAIGQTGAGLAAQGGMRQTGANLQDYMSQYTKGVVDPQLEALREFQQIQGQQAGSQEAMMGTQGSMRAGVESAQRAQDVSQQAANIIGSAQQDALRNAQQAFQADRAAAMQGLQGQLGAQQAGAQIGLSGLGAQQAAAGQGAQFGMQGQQQAFGAQQAGMGQGLQASQAAANLGQQGYQAQLGAMGQQGQMLGQAGQTAQAMGGMGSQMAGVASGQANLGAQQQQQQMARMQDLMGVGGYRQDRQQQLLNLQEQDRMNAMNQERQNINWQLGAMGSLPYQGSTIQSAHMPQQQGPTGFQQMASTGLAGMGAYNAFRNQTQRNQNQYPVQNQGMGQKVPNQTKNQLID